MPLHRWLGRFICWALDSHTWHPIAHGFSCSTCGSWQRHMPWS